MPMGCDARWLWRAREVRGGLIWVSLAGPHRMGPPSWRHCGLACGTKGPRSASSASTAVPTLSPSLAIVGFFDKTIKVRFRYGLRSGLRDQGKRCHMGACSVGARSGPGEEGQARQWLPVYGCTMGREEKPF